jgi:peptidoglycan/LPS O-acetylase OafA/YrhL
MVRRPLPALTGLRFVAAMMILLSHSIDAMLRFQPPVPAWALYLHSFSGVGMPLFFVLSGFVIHYNYAEPIAADRTRGIWNFFVARFARLYPLYILGIGFEFAFMGGYAQMPASTGQALPYYLSLTQSWFYVPVGGTALVFRFWLVAQLSWSVSTEWFFYCAYPLIAFFLAKLTTPRQTWWAMLAVSAAATAILLIIAVNYGAIKAAATARFGPLGAHDGQGLLLWLVYISPYSRIFEFLLGCLCAVLYLQVKDKPVTPAGERAALRLMIAAIVATLLLVWVLYMPLSSPLADLHPPHLAAIRRVFKETFTFAPIIAVFIFCCARYNNSIVTALTAPLIVLGGEASYSLYLLHDVVLHAFQMTVADMVSTDVGLANAAMWLVAMASAVGLSLVTWRLIEVPARRWLRRALLVRARDGAAPAGG